MNCYICGKELAGSENIVCEICEEKIKDVEMIKNVDSAKKKITNASNKYLQTDKNFYNDAAEIVREKMLCGEYRFRSINEICVAIQLTKENIKFIPNYPVLNYKVDFFMPEIKRILEVDGELYHKSKKHTEFFREREIMREVGEEFEIVRINASYVPTRIIGGLADKIEFVIEQRNDAGKFRNTNWDTYYFEQSFNLSGLIKNYVKRKC